MCVDILICAEDPGAANYLAPVPNGLDGQGISSVFLAHPRIAETLGDRNVSFELADENADADRLIATYKPRLLLIGTAEFPDCLGLQLVDAARRQGVPSLAVVDMSANVSGRFRGLDDDPLCHAPDWLGLCDQAAADEFEAIGFPADRIEIFGHPQFDEVRLRRQRLERQDRTALRNTHFPDAGDRTVFVFVAEGVDRLDPNFSRRSPGYSLAGRGCNNFRTSIVLEELVDATSTLDHKPYIVVRLHPKNSVSEFKSFAEEVDLLSVGGDPLPLVWAADGVIGMTSMLLVEAYILGRPTMAIVPREEEAALIVTTANGLTPVAKTRNEIQEKLQELCSAENLDRSDGLTTGALGHLVSFAKKRVDEVTTVGRGNQS